MTTLLFDYDPILYTVGAMGETRSVKVVHTKSGDEYEFPTKTDFWGHWKNKAGGWLAEYNEAKSEGHRRLPDEFTITDVQTPGSLKACMHSIKQIVAQHTETVGTKYYYGYSGKGKSFREALSTVIKYKGNRDGMLRPVHLEALKEYVVKYHSCHIVEEIEADDACSIDSYDWWQKWKKSKSEEDKLVLAFVDKDYYQCAAHLYNTNGDGEIISHEGFGKLWINDKNDVKGLGRMWLYQQVLDGDSADNYFANSASDMKWGQKSAYKLLKDCKNDKEAFEALVKGYKTIYPLKKTITGWRESEIEIDWAYMLQENFNMAKMLRWKGDSVNVHKVMDSLGVER